MIYICKKLLFLRGVKLEGKVASKNLKQSEADGNRVVQDQELNVVLLKLLDYLAHANPIVSGVAFNEVRVSSSPLSIKTN